jgi:hypothetical protein
VLRAREIIAQELLECLTPLRRRQRRQLDHVRIADGYVRECRHVLFMNHNARFDMIFKKCCNRVRQLIDRVI